MTTTSKEIIIIKFASVCVKVGYSNLLPAGHSLTQKSVTGKEGESTVGSTDGQGQFASLERVSACRRTYCASITVHNFFFLFNQRQHSTA